MWSHLDKAEQDALQAEVNGEQEAGDIPSFWLVLETGSFALYTSLSLIIYY